MRIVYTGTVYEGKQKPDILFQAIRNLKSDDIVEFYGDSLEWIEELAKQYDISENVKYFSYIPHKEIVKVQREADILLLLKWDSHINTGGILFAILSLFTEDIWSFRDIFKNYKRKETGVIPSKLFEYISAGKPILAIGGCNDSVTEILKDIQQGTEAYTVEDVVKYLLTAIQ